MGVSSKPSLYILRQATSGKYEAESRTSVFLRPDAGQGLSGSHLLQAITAYFQGQTAATEFNANQKKIQTNQTHTLPPTNVTGRYAKKVVPLGTGPLSVARFFSLGVPLKAAVNHLESPHPQEFVHGKPKKLGVAYTFDVCGCTPAPQNMEAKAKQHQRDLDHGVFLRKQAI